MFSIDLSHVAFLITVIIMVDSSFRKIKDGKPIDESMRYAVYLTKAEKSPTIYDAWICGGSIVSKDFIITSAACVEDVKFMYAIAGYEKYVNVKDIDKDKCTKASKKKVVFICIPHAYDFAYDRIGKWAFIDIAAIKVEKPYDFSLKSPIAGCTWVPDKIEINYDVKYQQPNTDAMILGWGHKEIWRKPGDPTDYNQVKLQYSSILIMNKPECKEQYKKLPELLPIIDKYMLCALHEGNINDKGEAIERPKPNSDGCFGFLRIGGVCQYPTPPPEESPLNKRGPPQIPKAMGMSTTTAKKLKPGPNIASNPAMVYQHQGQEQINTYQQSRSDDDIITFEDIVLDMRRRRNDTKTLGQLNYTRKAGICQNDHGGPLVTWVGKHERLIGVASVFRLDKDFKCIGPYLFTSTQCNGAFLDCVVNGDLGKDKNTKKPGNNTDKTFRRNFDICNQPPEQRGFDIVQRRISWRNHPDGPAANELDEDVFPRPMQPIY